MITCTTRTGKEVHLARADSSVTKCGHWLKTQASNYAIDAPATCEKCLGTTTTPAPAEATDSTHEAIRAAIEQATTIADADAIKAEFGLWGWSIRHAVLREMDIDQAIADARPR